MSRTNWKETKLFNKIKDIKSLSSDKVITLLENPNVMDSIETILDKGGTTPKDFTLHDSDHSYRVAERIWELIPEKTRNNLSSHELFLLLLSSYLHDIGMSPDFKKVNSHKEFLTTDTKDALSEPEINEFQKWIDNDDRTITIDIRKEKIEDTIISDYVLSYYIRSKHNDWSGEWITENLCGLNLDGYFNWQDDLIILCKSHHYDIDHLTKDIFNPKPIKDEVVHLRYLSMCLRVADVMENDPGRTPEVILKHRLINPQSLKYWLKDQRFNLIRDENKFTIYARPDKAYLHKAIEETAQWIENELKLCSELVKIRPLSYSSFKTGLDYYEWVIESFIHKDISPLENTYVYIQGGFRPNTSKILELLGGNQIYGNSIWAYRELIQNSFDAVKEKIAYQILSDTRSPSELINKFGNLYSINVTLEKKADGHWLIIKDQGVGMTKSIIEKYFLESGSSKRHEINELERRCKEKGFNFNRTGQFGIGVLSYFMLADKIIIKTKRELNTGYQDEDSVAWRFEINSAHDFGELIKYNKPINGTEIEIKLKSEIENEISSWDDKFLFFLKETIIKSPCLINYHSKITDIKESMNFGWTNLAVDIKDRIISIANSELIDNENIEDKILSLDAKNELLRKNTLISSSISEMNELIDFIFDEGQIQGIGNYRIYIPYFKLSKGNSFYYLKEDLSAQNHIIHKVNSGHFWRPRFKKINLSLKGIKIDGYFNNNDHNHKLSLPFPSTYIELDIDEIKTQNLSVSRHNLILENDFLQCIEVINNKTKELISKYTSIFNNCYSSLNKRYTNTPVTNIHWAFKDKSLEKEQFVWREIKYPLTNSSHYLDYDYKASDLFFRNKELNLSINLSHFKESSSFNLFDEVKGDFKAGFFNKYKSDYFLRRELFQIINEAPENFDRKDFFDLNKIELPPNWSNDILLISTSYKLSFDNCLINLNFPNIDSLNKDLLKTFQYKTIQITLDELKTTKECLAFLIISISEYEGEKWIGLCEKIPTVMRHVFKTLSLINTYIIDDGLVEINSSKWQRIYTNEILNKIAPNIKDNDFLIKKKVKK